MFSDAEISQIFHSEYKKVGDMHHPYRNLPLQVKLLHPDAKLPYKKHLYDAGYDLYSIEDIILVPGKPTKIRTGISIAIPNGYMGLICDRSSLGSKGIKVMGGVVDCGYTGEIIVCLMDLNVSTDVFPSSYQKISKNDRIAQIVLYKIENFDIIESEQLNSTERADGGFGSTGV